MYSEHEHGCSYSPPPLPSSGPLMMDPRWKTNIEIAPNCPRCASTNTKFCYYNNYSLSQPRYFCKACRRYWTKGGSLRNVPFGGGCRKNRRGKSVRAPAPHSGQASTSYSDSDHTGYGSDLANSGMTTRNGSDIDLADVFSKFLNQADSSSDPGLSEPELGFQNVVDDQPFDLSNSTSLNYDQMSQELCMDPIPDLEHAQLEVMFQPEFDNHHHQDRIPQQLVDSDPNALLGDGLWSDNNPLLLNSSRPQLQGWEQFFQDDHSLFHSNFFLGNWNSFDIPNYGI